jgi:hypothetical protein
MEGRALRPYPPVVVSFDGELAPASVENLSPIVVEWKRRDRRKQIIALPSDPDEDVETGTEFCVRHGPPGFQTVTVLGTASETSGDFNLDFAGYSRIEIFARRDGYESTAFVFDTTAENGAGASIAGLLGTVAVAGVIEGAVTVEIEGELPTIDIQFTEPVELEVELPEAITVTPVEGAVDTIIEITENFIIGVSSLLEATVDISVEAAGDIGTITATVPTATLEAEADFTAGQGIYAFSAVVLDEMLGFAEGEIIEPTTSMATPIWGNNGRNGGTISFSTASVTRYVNPLGQLLPYVDFAYTPHTTEGAWRTAVGAAGTIDRLNINVSSNARTTDTVFTLRVNGVDTTQTVTVGSGVTGDVITSGDPVAVAAGDLLSLKVVTGAGGGALALACTSMSFEADADVVMHHVMMGDLAINSAPSTSARGGPIHGTVEGNSFAQSWDSSPLSSGNGYEARVHTAGVMSRLAVYVPTNTATVDQTFTLWKSGSATALSVTIPANTTGVFTNNADEISLSPGDVLHYRLVATAGGGTGSSRLGWAQAIITRDVAEYDVYVAQRASDTLQGYSGSDHYMGLALINPNTTDDSAGSHTRQILPVGGVVSDLWVRYNHAGVGTSGYFYTLRKDGANTSLAANAPSSSGGGTVEDNTDTVNFADGDRVSVVFRTESFSQWPQAWGFTVSAAA